jgi:hypothetical protein
MSGSVVEPDWDWLDLHDRVTGLAAMVRLLDSAPLTDGTRVVALERLAVDMEEASKMAAFLVARAKEGGESWRSITTTP